MIILKDEYYHYLTRVKTDPIKLTMLRHGANMKIQKNEFLHDKNVSVCQTIFCAPLTLIMNEQIAS